MSDFKEKVLTATASLLRRPPKFHMHGKAYTPKYSLDPKIEKQLATWEGLDDRDLFLTHVVTRERFFKSDLCCRRAEYVVEEWDVFSTTVASYKDPTSVRWTEGVGLILEVPPQNIIGAFSRHVGVPLHERAHRYQLAHSVKSGISESGIPVKGGYRKIATPDKLLKRKVTDNEVLVVGRPHAHVHFAETRTIKVRGMVLANQQYLTKQDAIDNLELLRLLQVRNPHLAAEFI